jgi:hypothetical protein
MVAAMSQLSTSSDFSACGCQVSVSVTVTQNPIVYYDVNLGSPTDQKIVPSNAGLPALAFEKNGAGPGYVWNPANSQWN